jgi:hypothetical protein
MNTLTHKAVKNLLSKGTTNAKTTKNDLETFILYKAPSRLVDGFNLCPYSSEGCRKSCLYSAGRGRFSNVQLARINKSKYWAYKREDFYHQLADELISIHSRAVKQNKKIAVRLNGTTDVDHLDLLKRFTGFDFLSSQFSNMLFYDYTKSPRIVNKYLNTNYKITFSRSETNEADAMKVLNAGGNVAVVFNQLPTTWNGYDVINGDETDLRYFDKQNVVVGLKAKGDAKKDKSGFVI